MFDNIRQKIISDRADDEMLYEFVLDEIERGTVIKGLWGKAQADSGGDKSNAESIYLKYRVQSIKDAFTMSKIAYKGYSRSELYSYITDRLFINSPETIHLTSSSGTSANYSVSKEEEEIYEQVAQELASNVRKEGLWMKAVENTGGDEAKTKALYIKYRSQSIMTEREEERVRLRAEVKRKEEEEKLRIEEERLARYNSPEEQEKRLKTVQEQKEKIDARQKEEYIILGLIIFVGIVFSILMRD